MPPLSAVGAPAPEVTRTPDVTQSTAPVTFSVDERTAQYDAYWSNVDICYPHYPTIRHRKRFIVNSLRQMPGIGEKTVFDVGCGEGTLLQHVQQRFGLSEESMGGSDISLGAIERARGKVPHAYFRAGAYPQLGRTFDVMICSEVIEHTEEYAKLIGWMYEHLSAGGRLILTTQAGKIHASDRYTGHTQHFVLSELVPLLQKTGFTIVSARSWGFPLFTLQKYLTDIRFDHVREKYLEGTLSVRKRLLFSLTTLAYYIHDLIPFGPQIYIVAQKPTEQA
ncbi:class I SAM-dependent methyltransferase [Candidatus Peregrinibacteria bacterium]|nr:class I SAM-dependent methyltransferase [Candidatus Peregrinibacteria bacterium]